MKFRNGFVSNSSSSSFIVPVYTGCFNDDKRVITKSTEVLLKEYGFKYKRVLREYQLDISCNQCCTMKFLIEHNIPFKANCHYDQEMYAYDGKSDSLVMLNNFGNCFSLTYTTEEVKNLFKEKAGEYVPIECMTNCKCDNPSMCKEGAYNYV